MHIGPLYCAGFTSACKCACHCLSLSGISASSSPCWDIKDLLLDVPSFPPGRWTETSFDTLLASLPSDITVWGGNLMHPKLEAYRTIDLLKDESYLLENADITADCAIPIAEAHLKRPWNESSALIIGWGRIGKFLAEKLTALGCQVTVISRDAVHVQEASSRGYNAITHNTVIPDAHLVVNTAPAQILSITDDHPSVKIDLASAKGLSGPDIIWARGLPGRYAPERSGKLIADTILRLSQEVL